MGSNKRHKSDKCREQKKKRHRSRSRSISVERIERVERDKERHRHHKKHKKKERKDYDSDIEIVSAPPPPKISKAHLPTPPPPDISREKSPSPKSGGSQLSLSVEETNKLRAKLGLAPLDVHDAPKSDLNVFKDDLGEFHHKPAPNKKDEARAKKIKEKLSIWREKRQIETKLAKVKKLGESDSEDDARTWIEKNRKMQVEKKKAEERAKMLDQLDEEFGIGNLVKEEVQSERHKAYSTRDLKGLRVEHDVENFQEGRTTILTLKDQGVLDEDDDVLVNVNMLDDERYKRSVINKKKKPGYDAYEEDNLDEFGMPMKTVLEKYDEEIDGQKKESFALGVNNFKEMKERQVEIVKQRLANKRLESLKLAEPKLASEYYNEEEMAKFKKPKKKIRKIRSKKMLKATDLVPDSNDYLKDLGSRRNRKIESKPKDDIMDVDDYEAPPENISGIKIEEEDKEFDLKLARKKAKHSKTLQAASIEEVVSNIKPDPEKESSQIGNIVLNSTAEFCRTLGDIPTYGLSGNREENVQDLMDFQKEEIEDDNMGENDDKSGRGAWNSVETEESVIEPAALEAPILDVEPSLGQGVGGALTLAISKGYLQKEDSNRPSASRFAHLQAQNYSIEDKTYGDDDKFGRRDRFNGPTSEFKDKDCFKPNVKLEYIDDDGHVLSAKEAFRYLSHKFHGKGPGKNKVEKRMKKSEQEVLMKRMSSTDTPLGTLNLLQAKQKETQSPYIHLSGSKQSQTASISKSKH
ncbi:U4/U6.U5 tri-snRNP-associated protein 1 [Leptopilina boulardi]|uniref:U4/U6.U5 tri-snRNP-associated protein 1 n=1 Tax=Leptopilina boulardi TaxID=63433 RepID=UPI0021F501F0|nr:U4/U6.U5 tri-snRNP-associated protein 1 [Leptopilina boulardi]XP_051166099.1 U4/U6.U5 tri-snRNP-associated protein 1 [Leptopilina boulardi]